MKSSADIPCSTCPMWNPKRKSLSCNPNVCRKLAKWLLEHGKASVYNIGEEVIQYVV